MRGRDPIWGRGLFQQGRERTLGSRGRMGSQAFTNDNILKKAASSISSAIFGRRSDLIMDYESMRQYLKSVGPDFGISVSFSKYWTSKFTQNAVLVRFWLSSNEDYSTMNSRRVKAMVP